MAAMVGKKEPQYEDYEIDLADYIRVLLKGKWLILGITIISVVAAIGLSLVLPKTYEVQTILELGRYGRGQTESRISNLVEEPTQLVEKIAGRIYDAPIEEALGIGENDFPRLVAEAPKDTNLVKITVRSADAQHARDILGKLNELILAEHQADIDAKVAIVEENITRLETKIASLENERQNLEAKVAVFQAVPVYQQTIDVQNALLEAKSNLESKRQEIEDRYLEISALRSSLDDIEPTAVVKSPTTSAEPVSSKPLLNGAVAAMLGLFVGVFLAFGKEWWAANFK